MELSLLVVIIMIIALWYENRTVQEIAVAHSRRACQAAGVQFLDDIAPIWRIRLVRDADGHLKPKRVFVFEYTRGTGDRRTGSITMLGHTPIDVQLAQ